MQDKNLFQTENLLKPYKMTNDFGLTWRKELSEQMRTN